MTSRPIQPIIKSMEIIIARDVWKTQVQAIEGPTAKQVRQAVARRSALLATTNAARYAGTADDRTFDQDCEAWDIEADLIAYGYDPNTGRRAK